MTIQNKIYGACAALLIASCSVSALAATEVQWWHAMGGVNGERVNKIAADFNATQSEYKIVPSYKGSALWLIFPIRRRRLPFTGRRRMRWGRWIF